MAYSGVFVLFVVCVLKYYKLHSMSLSLPQKVRLSFLVSLILIAAISLLSYSSILLLIDNSKQADKTHEVLIKLRQFISNIKDAETGQRGYLLTNNREFLDSYYGTEQQVWRIYRELETALAASPVQQENLGQLRMLTDKRFARLEQIIRRHDEGSSYNLERSNQVMEELRGVVANMQDVEERQLSMWKENEGVYARRSPFFILLLFFSNLLLLGMAYVRIQRDINKQHEVEEKLELYNLELEQKVEERTAEIRQNEERYRFMTESIPPIVWTANPAGEMDYFSEKLSLYTGRPVEEMLGLEWIQVVHPDDRQYTIETWSRAIAEGQEERIEHRLLDHQGQSHWMLSHAVPYKNEEGKVTKWFGTSTFIDHEKQAIERALQKEEQLRQITDALPVLISYIDADLFYRFVNKKYEDWFQKSRDQIVDHRVCDILDERAFKTVQPIIKRTLEGERVNEEFESWYAIKGRRHMKINTIPHWQHKKVAGFYVLISDITIEKESEEQLRQVLLDTEAKNLELKRINHILDDFVSMAAHDLKSPVSNLKLSVLLINKLDSAEEKLRVIDYLDNSVKRLDNTLAGLLQILEVQHVKDASVSKCVFQDILQEVSANLQENLKEAGAQVISHFEDAPFVYYIRPYLLSIFHNLISNSAKYREPSRPLCLEVKSFAYPGGVMLEFHDNGIGMDLHKIGDKLYKPFKRFSTQAEGTGVGLHLIKSMIERNGGKISLKSKPGVGTVFSCYIRNMLVNQEIQEPFADGKVKEEY